MFTDGKQTLLLKRDEGDHQGTWGLPGGKAEKGESMIACAIRETEEETGIPNIPGNRIDAVESQDGTHRWTTYLYRIKEPFDVSLSEEHSEYKWVDLDKIKDLNLHPKFEAQLDRYFHVMRNRALTFREWSLVQ